MAYRAAMSAVVNVALPVFAIILAGWAAGRIGLLGRASSEALNRFVYWFAVPPLLFLAMARTPIDEIARPDFIAVFLIGAFSVAILAALIGTVVHRASPAEATMQGLNAGFSNTGYMGIPLFAAAFGDPGLAAASLATVLISSLVIGSAVIVLELAARSDGHLMARVGGALLAPVSNPLVLGPVLGIVWSLYDLPLPEPLFRLFDLLGAAASPCALFAIGLFLAGQKIGANLAEIGWVTILKLIWQPLITWALIAWVFPMDPFWAMSAILLAALPTGALTFVIAQRYGTYADQTSGIILVSTVLSTISLTLLLAIYTPRFGIGL